jgi:hypothetical protein
MKLQSFLNERDIALNKVEGCAKLKGQDKIKCKIEKYQDYIKDLDDAIKTSTSDDETKDLKRSLVFAKGVLSKLGRSKK